MSAASVGSAVVIGAGPAGCSCGVWLALQGVATTLLESAAAPAPLLSRLDLRQDWVLGFRDTSTAELAQRFREHVTSVELLDLRCGIAIDGVESLDRCHKRIRLADGRRAEGSALVFATGLRPRRPPWPIQGARQLHDAITLTACRNTLRGRRILLFGAGDNAVENALYLLDRGNSVVVWSRSGWRAQRSLQRRLVEDGRATIRLNTPLPTAVEPVTLGWRVSGGTHGIEAYDEIAVLFGFEPNDEAWELMRGSAAWRSAAWPSVPLSQAADLAGEGLFLAGDVSTRLHPCIQTALADGVTTSKQVIRWLSELDLP